MQEQTEIPGTPEKQEPKKLVAFIGTNPEKAMSELDTYKSSKFLPIVDKGKTVKLFVSSGGCGVDKVFAFDTSKCSQAELLHGTAIALRIAADNEVKNYNEETYETGKVDSEGKVVRAKRLKTELKIKRSFDADWVKAELGAEKKVRVEVLPTPENVKAKFDVMTPEQKVEFIKSLGL